MISLALYTINMHHKLHRKERNQFNFMNISFLPQLENILLFFFSLLKLDEFFNKGSDLTIETYLVYKNNNENIEQNQIPIFLESRIILALQMIYIIESTTCHFIKIRKGKSIIRYLRGN